jgi:hypothetical protein
MIRRSRAGNYFGQSTPSAPKAAAMACHPLRTAVSTPGASSSTSMIQILAADLFVVDTVWSTRL